MLKARARLSHNKNARQTMASFKSSRSVNINPEILEKFDRLQAMTDDYTDNLWNPLNLVAWEKVKYRPTQSQNRIRIQNRISLKKASDQKVRPRVKPIKRASQSVELSRSQPDIDYMHHFKLIMTSHTKSQLHPDDFQSQEEHNEVLADPSSPKGVLNKDKLKKYSKIRSFVEGRVEDKRTGQNDKRQTFCSQKLIGTLNSSWNYSPVKQLQLTTKSIISKNQEEDLKIQCILKKWKPATKIDIMFEASEYRPQTKKRYIRKELRKPLQLPLDTPRGSSVLNQIRMATSGAFAQVSRD